MLASNEDHITAVIRGEKMAEKIFSEQHRIGKMKITVCNFQKHEGQLKTGIHSTLEIDYKISHFT